MIVITGAAGFIASCLAGRLNEAGFDDLVLVDDFSHPAKAPNYVTKKRALLVERDDFPAWLQANADKVTFVFHLGARTDTTEFDSSIFDRLNVGYSQNIWKLCAQHGLPLVYASSAATYGLGETGYDDDESRMQELKPLNPY